MKSAKTTFLFQQKELFYFSKKQLFYFSKKNFSISAKTTLLFQQNSSISAKQLFYFSKNNFSHFSKNNFFISFQKIRLFIFQQRRYFSPFCHRVSTGHMESDEADLDVLEERDGLAVGHPLESQSIH